MPLFTLKWIAIILIFTTSVASGFATLRIAHKYKKWISAGEALANGIFLGAAFFHLLPAASTAFLHEHSTIPLLKTLCIALLSFILLLLLEYRMIHHINNSRYKAHMGSLIATLSIHAFLTGLALGITVSHLLMISLLIAIMAHKSFEVFALVINLHRHIVSHHVRWLFMVFSLVTPLGIIVGTGSHTLSLPSPTHDLFMAYLNAICAGTFIYIATIHAHHDHHPHADGYQKYAEILATLAGMGLMGILALWI